MAELKTKINNSSVEKFLNSVEDDQKRKDSLTILNMMKKISKEVPKMWGPNIVGFGKYDYKYKSGREGAWFLTGFSPRKQNLTIYIMSGFKRYNDLMKNLGKYKTGSSCLYIKKLEDVDMKVLKELISESVKHMKNKKW
jgi:nucleoid DNA-binding protein